MIERKGCPMRHPDNGNCQPAGGFCTAVSDQICEALHSAYDLGGFDLFRRIEEKKEGIPTTEEVAVQYLEICDEMCAGDRSVGIQPCPFYDFPDVDDDGEHPGGCRLERYRPRKDVKEGAK